MEILKETRFIERQQFFNGQRLFASDLQGLEAFNREMRWLHNKSLHQPGIGNGFAVVGKKDDREVQIGPGYAIDALGREIVLTQTQEEPVFCWVRLNQNRQPEDATIKQEILSGIRLILAQAEVLNCRLKRDISIA